MRFEPSKIPFGQTRPVFGRAAASERTGPPPLKGRAAIRHQQMVREAAALLPELPGPGESIDVLMLGYFDLAQVVVDVARRTKPRFLRIATLCWNRRNITDLAGLLEERQTAGDPLPLLLIASDFFFAHNAALIDHAREQFAPWSIRLVSARSHCKIVCFDLGPEIIPDDAIVFSGSANLRTNRNREQLTVVRDRALHDWHAAWMEDLASDGGAPCGK